MANKTVKVNEESQVRAGGLGTIFASLAGGPKWSTPLEAGVGLVQSITGPLVDNTDPKNPVIIPGGGLGDMASNIYDPANGARQVAFSDETVKLSGNQTIADVKTFSISPVVPTPTTDYQASTKKYVDDIIGTIPSSPVVSVNTRTGAVTGLAEASDLTSHTSNTSNPHSVTKAQVGLGSVDNTADAAKNVLSASKLTTARTIGGVSFDGSANINLPGVNATGNQNTTGSAATLTTARTINGVSFNGSANITIADATKVSLTGNETVGGAKIFSISPVVPTPTTAMQAATKQYVDNAVSAGGLGDVVGPSSAVNNNLAVFDGTTGKLLKDGGVAASVVVSTSGGQVLTDKRINPRVSTTASGSSLTPTIASYDQYIYTALAANLTINAPTGTPVNGNKLLFTIKDNGTSRTLTWNAVFRALGVTLPTATTANKTMYVGAVYNAANSKWDVIAVAVES